MRWAAMVLESAPAASNQFESGVRLIFRGRLHGRVELVPPLIFQFPDLPDRRKRYRVHGWRSRRIFHLDEPVFQLRN